MAQQLLFDLFNERKSVRPAMKPQAMRQCALGFLASQKPDAVACGVPVRFRKYKVAAAAFWTDSGRGKRLGRTAAVEVYSRREHCFADCAGRGELVTAIADLRSERERLEERIRRNEPHLQSGDDLFSEFRSWDYSRSTDGDYRELRRKLDRLQHALYKGSRLERIRNAAVADFLYLAVPHGLIAPDELASGWGLIYLDGGYRCTLVREAEPQKVEPEGRLLLAHNIAEAAREAVLFANGVRPLRSGKVSYSKAPRRRAALASKNS